MTLLRVSRNRLKRWMVKLGIETTDHPLEKRVKLLTDAQVDALREAMHSVSTLVASPEPRHVAPAVVSAQHITPVPAVHSSASKPYIRSTLPDGWVTLDSLLRLHNVHKYRALEAIKKEDISITEGEWKRGSNIVKKALSPDQQEVFLAWVTKVRA